MSHAAPRGLAGRVNDDNFKTLTLIAACFALFMAMLDNLVVNIAMPTGALLVLIDPIIPVPITLTTLVVVALVAVLVMNPPRDREESSDTGLVSS